jgi:hypothetical protein
VIYVPNIQFEFLIPAQIVPSINLRPPSDTRLDFVPSILEIVVSGQILGQERSWPYKAHVALEDIQKLWQLVQTESAEEFPESCEPQIIR